MNVLRPALRIEMPKPIVNAFAPKLAWPSLSFQYGRVDLLRFPDPAEERGSRARGEFGSYSEAFMKEVMKAQRRIWLVDGYLLAVPESLERCFCVEFIAAFDQTAVTDIRLLTWPKNGYREQTADLYRLRDKRREPPSNSGFTIEVKIVREGKSPISLPHDRFAVIDDELWHWGANVGGTHPDVNAYSRGWSADEVDAGAYFLRLWQQAENVEP